MNRRTIETEFFKLTAELQWPESELFYPADAILLLQAESDNFSVRGDFEVSAKDIAEFSGALTALYETLTGEAVLQDRWRKQELRFTADKQGYIVLRGTFAAGGQTTYTASFETSFDQTFLREFSEGLNAEVHQYL